MNFKMWLEHKAFAGQSYSDNDGEWKVSEIWSYIQKNHIPIKQMSVSQLAKTNFQPTAFEIADELPGSPEFVQRANKADLQYPIMAITYPDGIFICDGVHRLWKAREKGLKTISVYLLDKKTLDKIPQTDK